MGWLVVVVVSPGLEFSGLSSRSWASAAAAARVQRLDHLQAH
jgi:hypothetical protein